MRGATQVALLCPKLDDAYAEIAAGAQVSRSADLYKVGSAAARPAAPRMRSPSAAAPQQGMRNYPEAVAPSQHA